MKLPRIASLSDCVKCRLLLDAGKARLAWRRAQGGRELILKTASGADQAIIAAKFENQFRDYAGRWGKAS